ncbi:MAG TPA: hypothetical protein VKV73_27615 [Chloroflexota bacterium]|nr:hypothetical protein [Chloroflexota bacterium]
MLSFAGFSGTALVTFNLAVRDYLGPLAVLSVVLMALSIVLVARSINAACKVSPPDQRAVRLEETATRHQVQSAHSSGESSY